ncbi:hypothetical protein [Pseudomonas xantholysinigenes]|uniref:Uncharacterized protein n=1 Tax=Pseudomonas xantholysinigenes TaxID=2745490 RepID=A0A9E6TZP8_9PSED|nr:hypothetical protein [Pseudomonas xantholysinigenes]QXI40341.1 hypothetical protein HU772_009820 [Pseudomonas xantholysinigenes]
MDLLTSVLIDLLLRGLCYPLGWPVVKLFSLGRHPRPGGWLSDRRDADWTAAIGLLILVLALLAWLV